MRSVSKSILFLLITLVSLPGFSQKLSKYYQSKPQDIGTLYFIYPFEEFRNTSDGSYLSFDITYLNGSDSAVINFTCFSKETQNIDSLILYADHKIAAAKTNKLLIERFKKSWKYRYSATFVHTNLFEFITSSSNPSIIIKSNGKDHLYTVSKKKWSKYSKSMSHVTYIIGSE